MLASSSTHQDLYTHVAVRLEWNIVNEHALKRKYNANTKKECVMIYCYRAFFTWNTAVKWQADGWEHGHTLMVTWISSVSVKEPPRQPSTGHAALWPSLPLGIAPTVSFQEDLQFKWLLGLNSATNPPGEKPLFWVWLPQMIKMTALSNYPYYIWHLKSF